MQIRGRFRPLIAERIIWENNSLNSEAVSATEEHIAFWINQLEGAEVKDINEKYLAAYTQLMKSGTRPKKIVRILEEQFPINNRILQAGKNLLVLPSERFAGKWYSIHAIALLSYDLTTNSIKPIQNFTTFPDNDFRELQKAFRKFKLQDDLDNDTIDLLSSILIKNYHHIEGLSYSKFIHKSLRYPSYRQIKAEHLYYSYPWTMITLILYALAALFLVIASLVKTYNFSKAGLIFFYTAFLLHTFLIALRCYILLRPPVSNMHESLLFVPWIACFVSIILKVYKKTNLPLILSSLASLFLLFIVQKQNLYIELENVQAVLDSEFWLTIHVLMVVSSYGMFILAGGLGHIYLLIVKSNSKRLIQIQSIILQMMYVGVFLLAMGTVLGGVWAAESWGRFWDWDPKESWAFISVSSYLIAIHLYRFHHISAFGLAIASILGLQVVTFTWYGVNYILGTGLHSYGFGNGGVFYYLIFIGAETIFIIWALVRKSNHLKKSLQEVS